MDGIIEIEGMEFSLSTDVMKQNVSWETNSWFTPVSKQIAAKLPKQITSKTH